MSERRWLATAALLSAYSFAMMLVVISVQPQAPGNIKRPFAEHLVPHFVRGELAISRVGIDEPYEKLKELTRGHVINRETIRAFIEGLELAPEDKAYLLQLTPAGYVGMAEELVGLLD